MEHGYHMMPNGKMMKDSSMVRPEHMELAKAFMQPPRVRSRKKPEMGMKALPDEMEARHDFMYSPKGRALLKRVTPRTSEIL